MHMTTSAWIAIFAISSAGINFLGILAIYKKKTWTESVKTNFMCFAAGVLISVPLLLTLPHATKLNPNAGIAALAGFLFLNFSNVFFYIHVKKKSLVFSATALEGIGIHSFVDGMIYTVTFSVSILAGFLAGIGLIVHEFAEGVITYSVLREAKVEKKKAVFYAFLVSSLTTPIGAFVAYPLMHKLDDSYLGLALGFVSGVLIYVSASHLLPATKATDTYRENHSMWAFLVGVTLAIFIVFTQTMS